MTYKYPFKKPSCVGERYWHFRGDNGVLYANLNGPKEFAILNIGYEHPELKTLTWVVIGLDGSVMGSYSTYNIDKFFADYGITRPK